MEVQRILKASYNRVKRLLSNNFHMLKKLAEELVVKETLKANEIKKLLKLNT
jgi:ATP-dependent Zn protease